MSNILQKLFRKPSETYPGAFPIPTKNPVAAVGFTGKSENIKAVAGAWEGEAAQGEYDEFCATFFHKPDVKFIDFLNDNQIIQLKSWLQPETLEPEPKAFIRLIREMHRQGIQFWEEEGVTIYLKKRAEHGGGPSPESTACLSLLAQVLEKPITCFHPAPESEVIQVLEFTPRRDNAKER